MHDMKNIREKLLNHSKKVNEFRKNSGYLGTISPAPKDLINDILMDIIPNASHVQSIVMFDLGCGDGRWLLSLAKKHFCVCLGLEIEKERLLKAKQMYEDVNNNMKGVVEFVHANFLNVSLSIY